MKIVLARKICSMDSMWIEKNRQIEKEKMAKEREREWESERKKEDTRKESIHGSIAFNKKKKIAIYHHAIVDKW